jgi:curved DNA-binding protein CbpA
VSNARFRDLDGRDAYEILGVAPTATRQEISRGRRDRQRTAHPDSGVTGDEYSKLINAAAAILLDEARRQEYDRWRQKPEPPPPQWDTADPGFTAPTTRPEPSARSPYRGVEDPVAPRPGPGPGMAPTYGVSQVMPHLGQPPPQYYHAPTAAKGNGGKIALIVGLAVVACCMMLCLLNLLAR